MAITKAILKDPHILLLDDAKQVISLSVRLFSFCLSHQLSLSFLYFYMKGKMGITGYPRELINGKSNGGLITGLMKLVKNIILR